MFIAIVQRGEAAQSGEAAQYQHAESVRIALARGADAIILRGFEGRYGEIVSLYEAAGSSPCGCHLQGHPHGGGPTCQSRVSHLKAKLLINALPDQSWVSLQPDGFHLNRHNVEIMIQRPEFVDMVRDKKWLLGASVHNSEEMRRALLLNHRISLAYLLISPIFKPSYDQMAVELGIEGFKRLYETLRDGCGNGDKRPTAVALGGINSDSVKLLLPHRFVEGIASMSATATLPDEALLRWSKDGI